MTTISSSESESWTASGVEVTRGSESSKLSEATTAMVREGASRPNYLDMNTAVRGVLVRFTVPARYRYKEPMRGLLEGHHADDAHNEGRFISKVTHEAYSHVFNRCCTVSQIHDWAPGIVVARIVGSIH